jgi:methionine synthase II (cobalamin-independent)
MLEARGAFFQRKAITAEQLRTVEDRAIAKIVEFQRGLGLQSLTDDEFRRTHFHIDFLEQLDGAKTDIPVAVRREIAIRVPYAHVRSKASRTTALFTFPPLLVGNAFRRSHREGTL